LSSNSIVFDVGGYKGDWAQQIHNQYNSNIHIFEPVNEYYNQIVTRFSGIDNISVYHFGLSGKTRETQISKLSDGSSVYRHSSIKEEIRLIDICEFVEENSINRIDLVKINIEGGEYELLNRITDCTMVNKIQNIQVQFHDCVSNAKALRNSIREKLKKTHTLTYDYYFIWENWQKKK
jgi:FkbM family methyltransferase